MTYPQPSSYNSPPPLPIAIQLKAVRRQLGLSQAAFARTFALSVGTVRDWEQGRFQPDRAARVLLQVIAHNPDAVKAALLAWHEALKPQSDEGRCDDVLL
jgi:DNA-binding transcriptional regulator YiaG